MTIIAYRDGVIAADRMIVTSDDLRVGARTKIVKAHGCLAGGAGASGDVSSFLAWAAEGCPEANRPTLNEDFSGMVIEADGRVRRYNKHLSSSPLEAPYYAVGSGAGVALGAFFMGASAHQAALAACEHAVFCGGIIDILKLEDTDHA